MAEPAEILQQALAAYQRGELGDAERLCRDALAADRGEFDGYHLLAVIHARRGEQRLALAAYDLALLIRPDDPRALSNRAVALDELGQYAEALASCERALAQQPDYLPALSNRGNALRALQRFEEALASYDRALALAPEFPEALSNRGTTLDKLGRYDEALASYDRALALRPDFAQALSNRGLALRRLGRVAEALISCDRALAIRSDYAECRANRAALLLLLGRMREGWREFEWRRHAKDRPPRDLAAAEWRGEDLDGKRLLLYADGEVAETIQFARFARLLAGRGATIIVEVQPALAEPMRSLAGASEIIALGAPSPPSDWQLPLMSVPAMLNLSEAEIPAETPYLAADPVRVADWAGRLPDGEFRVGIAWRGGSDGAIPLAAFAALADIGGVRLIGLQDLAAGPRPALPIVDLGGDIAAGPDPLGDAAAVIVQLDLVIACDGAIAHLAGALGRPVWVALGIAPEWSWMLGRAGSPWYPTARLFRQDRAGDWDTVMVRVAAALTEAIAAGSALPALLPSRQAADTAIPAYVICLGRRPDRRERFFRWNAGKGIEFAVFDAVDGSKLAREDLIRQRIIEADLPFSNGAVGNGLSHKRLWEICVEANQAIIVFEDDAYVPHSLKDWFPTIRAELQERCELFYLGYNRNAVLSVGFGNGQWSNIAFEEPAGSFDSLAEQHDRWSNAASHCAVDLRLGWGILAYAVSPRGAELLLQHCFPMSNKIAVRMFGSGRMLTPYALDGIINTVIQRGLVRARALFPPLVIGPNEEADSDITPSGKPPGS